MKALIKATAFVTIAALSANASATRIVTTHPSSPTSVTVQLGDLNLTENTGAREAYRRISSASRKVCGKANNWTPLYLKMAQNECVTETLDNAVDAINSRALNGIHNS